MLLAVALIGATVALLSGGGSADAPAAFVATAEAPVTIVRTTGGRTARPAAASPVATSPQSEDRAAIRTLLRDYYGAVADGRYAAAWALLSPTYKAWKASNGGRPKWQLQEEMNHRHLTSWTPSVRIASFDEGTGIATIRVSGMTYDEPGRGPCAYEGITWARRAGSRWLYDQGYLQRADRAVRWRPRRAETLGYPCQDGY